MSASQSIPLPGNVNPFSLTVDRSQSIVPLSFAPAGPFNFVVSDGVTVRDVMAPTTNFFATGAS